MNNQNKTQNAVIKTIKKLAPNILTALVATALGLLSLYTSPVPMIQDFGKMLSIGMVVSFVFALIILIPILFVRDRFFPIEKKKVKNKTNNKFESVMKKITNFTLKFKYVIFIFAIVIAGVGVFFDQLVGVETDIETFMPQDTQELLDIQELRRIIETTEQLSIVYSSDDIFTDDNIAWIEDVTNNLIVEFPNEIVSINSITGVLNQLTTNPLNSVLANQLTENLPEEQLKMLINEDLTKGVIIIQIEDLSTEELTAFITNINDYLVSTNSHMDVTVTGQAVIDLEMMTSLTTGRYTITLIGMALVFVGLLIIYRDPLKAIIPLIPITLIVGWSGGVMYLFDMKYTPLTATLGALIIGIGTEFTILIMGRYYEEKAKTKDNNEAIKNTLGKMGKPIIASALTTIGGFSALVISDFEILSNFGIMTLVNITFALISTIFIMPIVLSIQYTIVNKFKKNKAI